MRCGILEDAGIDAIVVGDDVGGMYAGVLGGVRLLVAPADADRAREILAEWDEPA